MCAVDAPREANIKRLGRQPGAGDGAFENASHQTVPSSYLLGEDFLIHSTHPAHEKTGEPVNWLRLPVLDRG
ncbi:hypothetical protein A3Q37_00205 [Streptomyces sp. PTY087I2]|nr:hypothetical protein A3Q37_00205 [Streptomyces sp. PTY087I2]